MKPITRKEIFLAGASGDYTDDLPTPVTREEIYLKKIAENGGGGDVSAYAHSLELTMNSQTYVLTATLKNTSGETLGTPQTIDLPLETMVVSGSYDDITKKVILTLKNGNTVDFSVADLVSGLQTEITSTNKLSSDLVDDTNQNNKFVTSAEKAQIATNTQDIAIIKSKLPTIFGLRINKNDSNPATKVEYLYDAVGMTPAHMDYTNDVFDYGSWGSVWFVRDNRPVALKFDGTVDYELDHSDFAKKLDGTASDITDTTYGGSFMSEIPLCYIKRWEDENYNYIAISSKPVDDSYKAYAHTNENGIIKPQIYLPMFKGSVVSGKLRSIAGQFPTGNTTGTDEVSYATACGEGWQLWDWSKHELIADLLTLISRSTDSKGKFGKGDINSFRDVTPDYGKQPTGGYCQTVGDLSTFAVDSNGQFYGKNDDTHHVTAFYIEDFWGNRYERCLGLNIVEGVYTVKMIPPYVLNTDSTYTTVSSVSVPSSDWLKNISTGDYGGLPSQTGATETTDYCNSFYSSYSSTRLARFGGSCRSGSACGYRCFNLYDDSSANHWFTGGSPCFNPI